MIDFWYFPQVGLCTGKLNRREFWNVNIHGRDKNWVMNEGKHWYAMTKDHFPKLIRENYLSADTASMLKFIWKLIQNEYWIYRYLALVVAQNEEIRLASLQLVRVPEMKETRKAGDAPYLRWSKRMGALRCSEDKLLVFWQGMWCQNCEYILIQKFLCVRP